MLSMDLGNAVQARLGLECFIDRRPERIHQWRVLLDYFQDVGLCTSTAARALLSWHGICQRGACPERWLRSLDLVDRLLGPIAVSLFARFLSHIKIVSQPETPLQAKGYLGVAHYWFDPAKSRKHATKGYT